MLGIKHLFKAMHASLTRVDTKRIYLFSLVIGAVTGVGAVAFYWCFTAAVHLTYEVIARIPVTHPGDGEPLIGGWTAEMIGEPRRWVFLIMPAIGGLFAGWIVHRFAPEAAGTGTEGFIDAFHNRGGVVRSRVALVKSIALKKLGTPEDIAFGVLYFASDLARWVTGQVLSIDGEASINLNKLSLPSFIPPVSRYLKGLDYNLDYYI